MAGGGRAPGPEEAAALAAATLPTDDPAARDRIATLFVRIAELGEDPAAATREALARWFGAGSPLARPWLAAGEGAGGARGRALAVEPLARNRPPTLWPQRPRRLPDELLSSWLRRCAVVAGAPPRAFARDVLGDAPADLDADASDATLRRLALAGGHAPAELAAGTLRPGAGADTPDGRVEDAALARGGLLLGALPRARSAARVQFCPLCLGEGGHPAFRRRWRLAYEVACDAHGCLLRDRCHRCGAAFLPLAGRSAAPSPGCARCGEPLRSAPVARATSLAAQCRRRRAHLARLLDAGEAGAVRRELDALAAALATAPPDPSGRAGVVARLPPVPAPPRKARRPRQLVR